MEEMVFKGTTILAIRHGDKVALGGDGQVSFGNTIMKSKACKIRRLYDDKILAGFAGTAADAFTLFEQFEGKLKEYHGNLVRAAVELAKQWRTDKYLRKLEALLAVVDKEKSLIIAGSGEVIEPDDNIIAIGSGGPYALAAARALVKYSPLPAAEICKEALKIAAQICVFTNDYISVEEIF